MLLLNKRHWKWDTHKLKPVAPTLERAMTNVLINFPADYIRICKSARKHPQPYDITNLDHTFFCKSIHPVRGKGDSKVTDIRAIKYTSKAKSNFLILGMFFPRGSVDNHLPLRTIVFFPVCAVSLANY